MIIGGDRAEQRVFAREIEPAEDPPDQRHDHILGQRGGDLGEGRADDHRHGEIEHVAAHDEIPEFPQHKTLPVAEPKVNAYVRFGPLRRRGLLWFRTGPAF